MLRTAEQILKKGKGKTILMVKNGNEHKDKGQKKFKPSTSGLKPVGGVTKKDFPTHSEAPQNRVVAVSANRIVFHCCCASCGLHSSPPPSSSAIVPAPAFVRLGPNLFLHTPTAMKTPNPSKIAAIPQSQFWGRLLCNLGLTT
ncbi:hypothetical protein A2U01_0005243 [Trifolium medium]|uniref:Uncharacterized protein n=1 Tax=Trifolium medium TaxID=97028 RepID=A0A392MAV0_9FABA|nr:hypothetical protein [Trifolium medium]